MVDKALHSLALSVKEAFDSEEDLKKKRKSKEHPLRQMEFPIIRR